MLSQLRKAAVASGLMVAASGMVATGQVAAQQMPPAQVEVVTAEVRTLAPSMDLPGTVISLNDSRIAAEVEGPVTWIAQVGTAVNKGDVVAKIDARLLTLQLRQAEATLARLKADMVFRKEEVTRYEALANQDNASKSRLQEVIAAQAMLEQDILEAEALLDKAAGDLKRAEIRAPFPGHMAARLVNVGEYVTPGEEVLRLVDTAHKEIALAAPITLAPYLQEGMEVPVYDDLKSLTLPIRTVVPVGDMTSRMMEVRLKLVGVDWIVGSAVKVQLPKGQAQKAVAVPRDAMILKGADTYFFKVTKDNTAERIEANPRSIVGQWMAAGSGVEAGDKIVIRGGERLAPGQSVIVAQ